MVASPCCLERGITNSSTENYKKGYCLCILLRKWLMTITPIPASINVCIQPIRNIKPITVMSRFCPFAHLGWMLRKPFIVLFSGRAVILWFIPETLKAEAVECIRLRAFWLIHKVALINELLHQPHSPQPLSVESLTRTDRPLVLLLLSLWPVKLLLLDSINLVIQFFFIIIS